MARLMRMAMVGRLLGLLGVIVMLVAMTMVLADAKNAPAADADAPAAAASPSAPTSSPSAPTSSPSAAPIAARITYGMVAGKPYTVDYDYRAIRINGQRVFLQSGSVHYPRSSPSMWPALMQTLRASGLNTLQTYVFWNYHETVKGTWDWTTESRNLGEFLQAAADAGLFVNLRLGPFVCAEWFFGGIPLWLHDQGFDFRAANPGWESAMTYYVRQVIAYVEPWLARNGGPIILAQIENEYGVVGNQYSYVEFCADLALSTQIDVPWIMCKQPDAPAPLIYTCNGFECDFYVENQQQVRQQPAMWTENWTGWLNMWGQSKPSRPVQNIAYAVGAFVAKGGSFHNYYMWQGGSNFGTHQGGPGITTTYDYDAPVDEYGAPHEPKFTHLTNLHTALTTYAIALMSYNMSLPVPLGQSVWAYAYGPSGQAGSVVFLVNNGTSSTSTVTYGGVTYVVAPYSVQIVDGVSNQVVFDTSVLPNATSSTAAAVATARATMPSSTPSQIAYVTEPIGAWSKNPTLSKGPIDQIQASQYLSFYMWYITNVTLTQEQISAGSLNLELGKAGDVEHIFFNGVKIATLFGASNTTVAVPTSGLAPGLYSLNILNVLQGLVNFPWATATNGVTGSVLWDGVDITSQQWAQQVGTLGEFDQYYAPSSVVARWITTPPFASQTPLTWYKLTVDTPSITVPFADATFSLDLSGMTKGSVWVNGFMVGSYWNLTGTTPACDKCTYEGAWSDSRCRYDCGAPSQSLYHVPRDVLAAPGSPNMIVLFEEVGGDPTSVVLAQKNAQQGQQQQQVVAQEEATIATPLVVAM